MADSRADELCRITSSLFSKKQPWNQLCQSIADIDYPLRADFTTDFTLGDDFAGLVMDSFTINSRETLGNAIDSMLRQGEWFQLGTGDEERDNRPANAIALKRGTEQLRKVVRDPRTNFDVAMKEADHDWVAFGNPVLSWEEAPTRDSLVLRAWHPKLCAWMVDEAGKVNANHRRMNMQARNIKRKFDTGQWKGRLHKDIEKCCKEDPTKEFPIAHVLMPIDEIYGDDHKMMRQHKHQFISIYIDETHREILNELGSKVFNYVIPRYRTLTGIAQGFSPHAINSLPDGRMLQAMAMVILEQGEKAVDPPIVGSADVFVREMNLYAGGFTSVDLAENQDIRNAMQVVETSQGLATGLQLKQDVRQLIAEAWLLNKLFLPNVREMRELEVMVRTEEFRRAALPFFNPIESQYHSPILSTGFEMAVNMGYIDGRVFPEELQDEDVSFTFHSPIKEAEGQKVVAAFDTSVRILAAGAQVDETLAEMFDIRRAAVDAVRGAGAEPEWIKSEDEQKRVAAEGDEVKNLQKTAALLQQGAAATQDVAGAKMAAEQAGLV
jgi:hypothetical protein